LLLTVWKFVIEALAGLYSIMQHDWVLNAFDVVLLWRADLCCCLNQALKDVWGATEQVDLWIRAFTVNCGLFYRLNRCCAFWQVVGCSLGRFPVFEELGLVGFSGSSAANVHMIAAKFKLQF
jgi:hypothetical protein